MPLVNTQLTFLGYPLVALPTRTDAAVFLPGPRL
jgi:hypothetical protein